MLGGFCLVYGVASLDYVSTDLKPGARVPYMILVFTVNAVAILYNVGNSQRCILLKKSLLQNVRCGQLAV